MDELWKFTAYVYFVQKDGEHIFYNDYMNFIWNFLSIDAIVLLLLFFSNTQKSCVSLY
jgi:hypothetical protein